MKLFDKLIPIIVIILVAFLGYLLYNNKNKEELINVPITKNNINEQFLLTKEKLDATYGAVSYENIINDINVTCYHELKRCYEFNEKQLQTIILLTGNNLNSFNDVIVDSDLELLNKEIIEQEKKECFTYKVEEEYKNYNITYLTKELCKNENKNINMIIIKK